MAFPLAGLMFDFLDGKVARWRKSTSLLGQELDSLADLVHLTKIDFFFFFIYSLASRLDIVRSRPCTVGICSRA